MTSEKKFIPFLQKNINIVLDNKTLKQGKLLLFCIKDFYLIFTLACNNGTKTFELPYPFATYMESVSSGILILDYRIKTLTTDIPTLTRENLFFNTENKQMKFFNNIIKMVEVK